MQRWKKGRGKLGIFHPLMGQWVAHAETDMGPLVCTRKFHRILDHSHIELDVYWDIPNRPYSEKAIIGVSSDKEVCFWSFTSDGKQSQGKIADVTDIDPQAIGFEAQMPAGLARMAYWPHESEGFLWAVESKNKNGWKRFVEHHYVALKD